MRGAPQSWYAVLICLITARNSISMRGHPPARSISNAKSDESRPDAIGPASRVGRNDIKHQRKPSIRLDEESIGSIRTA
jgi:hypothetical protein